MSSPTRPGLRWAVPGGVTALVLGGAVAGPALSASAEVELPERSAAQLLTDLHTADVEAFSGTVRHTADLGLPALPEGMGGEHGTDLGSLLDGTHEIRVWASGEKGRVAITGRLGEYGIVSDGDDLWTWSSDDNTATHVVLPEHEGHEPEPPTGPPVTPEGLTETILAALDPTTRVTAGTNDTVAGRPAYELVLAPEDDRSLIGSVHIAVDAAEHVPTRVRVLPAGSDVPAVDVAYTELSFATPADEIFDFSPAPGVTVRERVVGGADAVGEPDADGVAGDDVPAEGAGRAAVVGDGWSRVLVTRPPTGEEPADPAGDDRVLGAELGAVLEALPWVPGDAGTGRVLTSRILSALLTDDGRLLVGAVDAATLRQAAGDPAAALD